jgi:hypothetical protein
LGDPEQGEGRGGYYLDIVAIGTTLSGTHWQAGQRGLLTGTVGCEGGREALHLCQLTDLLEQTKCQSLLALAERARMVARKIYIIINRKLCMTLFDKIKVYHMNLS